LWDFARYTQLRAVIPALKKWKHQKNEFICSEKKNAGKRKFPAFFF
jgi:hypothetical protein